MTPTSSSGRRRAVWAVAAVIVVALVGGAVWLWQAGPDGTGRSTRDVDPAIDRPASTENVPLSPVREEACPADWVEPGRACRVVLPEQSPASPLPAVVVLHGYSANPEQMISEGGWVDAAGRHGLVVVAPGGIGDSWHGGLCCGEARGRGVDDGAYLADLVDSVAAMPQVDPAQVYVVGFSNGGLMVYKLLCAAGDRIAGAASVAGTDVAGCPASEPVSVLHLHGTADEVVPYEGGFSAQSLLMGVNFPPVTATFKKMAIEQNCDPQPEIVEEPEWTVTRYVGCDGETELELRTVEGGTHRYQLVPDVDTTEVILDYFGLT